MIGFGAKVCRILLKEIFLLKFIASVFIDQVTDVFPVDRSSRIESKF